MDEVKRWLQQTYHIKVPDDWLEACIDFIVSDNQGRPLSSAQLKPLVHEQWLVSDLRELACSCLPEQLSQAQKFTLNGFYALQMDSAVDVSVSFYSQLQKKNGTENANAHVSAETQPSQPSWAAKSNRLLMLNLTDGVQSIQAMEYQRIPALSAEMTPGAKVLIQGEVLCRLGVLMLTRDNVKVLGGEVDALLEENDPENVLTRILEENRNIDPDKLARQTTHPKQDTLTSGSSSQSRAGRQCQARQHTPVSQYQQRQQTPSNQFSTRQQTPNNQHPSRDKPLGTQTRITQPGQVPPHTSYSTPCQRNSNLSESMDFPDDDDLLDTLDDGQLAKMEEQMWEEDIDYDAVMDQVENEIVSQNPSTANVQNVSSDRVNETSSMNYGYGSDSGLGFSDRLSRENDLHVSADSNKRPKITPVSETSSRFNKEWNSSGSNIDDKHKEKTPPKPLTGQRDMRGIQVQKSSDTSTWTATNTRMKREVVDLTADENSSDFDLTSTVSATPAQRKGIGLHTPPFTYLSLAKKMLTGADEITIKGYISTVTSKLEHNNGRGWTLGVRVNDGTAAMDMDLSDQMLTRLIGFTAAESLKLREAAKSDLKVRSKLTEGIKQCQKSLISLSCLLDVRFPGNGGKPCILRHRDMTAEDIRALKARLDWEIDCI